MKIEEFYVGQSASLKRYLLRTMSRHLQSCRWTRILFILMKHMPNKVYSEKELFMASMSGH